MFIKLSLIVQCLFCEINEDEVNIEPRKQVCTALLLVSEVDVGINQEKYGKGLQMRKQWSNVSVCVCACVCVYVCVCLYL